MSVIDFLANSSRLLSYTATLNVHTASDNTCFNSTLRPTSQVVDITFKDILTVMREIRYVFLIIIRVTFLHSNHFFYLRIFHLMGKYTVLF